MWGNETYLSFNTGKSNDSHYFDLASMHLSAYEKHRSEFNSDHSFHIFRLFLLMYQSNIHNLYTLLYLLRQPGQIQRGDELHLIKLTCVSILVSEFSANEKKSLKVKLILPI